MHTNQGALFAPSKSRKRKKLNVRFLGAISILLNLQTALAQGGVYGDVNADGTIDFADAISIFYFAREVQSAPAGSSADELLEQLNPLLESLNLPPILEPRAASVAFDGTTPVFSDALSVLYFDRIKSNTPGFSGANDTRAALSALLPNLNLPPVRIGLPYAEGPEPHVTLFLNPADTLLYEVVTPEGTTVRFFASKTAIGVPLALASVEIEDTAGGKTTIEMDVSGRPSLLRNATGLPIALTWLDDDTLQMTAMLPDGTTISEDATFEPGTLPLAHTNTVTGATSPTTDATKQSARAIACNVSVVCEDGGQQSPITHSIEVGANVRDADFESEQIRYDIIGGSDVVLNSDGQYSFTIPIDPGDPGRIGEISEACERIANSEEFSLLCALASPQAQGAVLLLCTKLAFLNPPLGAVCAGSSAALSLLCAGGSSDPTVNTPNLLGEACSLVHRINDRAVSEEVEVRAFVRIPNNDGKTWYSDFEVLDVTDAGTTVEFNVVIGCTAIEVAPASVVLSDLTPSSDVLLSNNGTVPMGWFASADDVRIQITPDASGTMNGGLVGGESVQITASGFDDSFTGTVTFWNLQNLAIENNFSREIQVLVLGLPDLELPPASWSYSEAPYVEGSAMTVGVAVQNRGGTGSARSKARLSLAPTPAPGGSAVVIGELELPEMPAGGGEALEWPIAAIPDLGTGTYDVWAIVEIDPDDTVREASTGDGTTANTFVAPVPLSVVDPTMGAQADLAIVPSSFQYDSFPIDEGAPFWIDARVRNIGSGAAAASTARLSLILEPSTGAVRRFIGNVPVEPLGDGEEMTLRWDIARLPNLGDGPYDAWALIELDALEDVDEVTAGEGSAANTFIADISFTVDEGDGRDIPQVGDPVPITGRWTILAEYTEDINADCALNIEVSATLEFRQEGASWTYQLSASETPVGACGDREKRTWEETASGTYLVELLEYCPFPFADELCGLVRLNSDEAGQCITTGDQVPQSDEFTISSAITYRVSPDGLEHIDRFPTCFLNTFSQFVWLEDLKEN